jgi:hypothetical protein
MLEWPVSLYVSDREIVIAFGQQEVHGTGFTGCAFLRADSRGTGPVAERLRVGEIHNDEGQRLLRIICGPLASPNPSR